jgi:hypothetical protein
MNKLYIIIFLFICSCSHSNQIGAVRDSDSLSLGLNKFIEQSLEKNYKNIDDIFSKSLVLNINDEKFSGSSSINTFLDFSHNIYSDIFLEKISTKTYYFDDNRIITYQKVDFLIRSKHQKSVDNLRSIFEYVWSNNKVVELNVVFESDSFYNEIMFYNNNNNNVKFK